MSFVGPKIGTLPVHHTVDALRLSPTTERQKRDLFVSLGHGGRKGCIPKRFVLQQRTQTTDERRPLPSPAEQSRAAPSAIPAGIDRFPAGRRSSPPPRGPVPRLPLQFLPRNNRQRESRLGRRREARARHVSPAASEEGSRGSGRARSKRSSWTRYSAPKPRHEPAA